jgi:SnoaL-like domain
MSTTQELTHALQAGDPAAIAAALATDVTFHTPILTDDLHGRELALRFLGLAEETIDGLNYYDRAGDDDLTILFWRSTIAERDVEGVTVVKLDDSGLVSDLTVLMRSWAVVAIFRDAMLLSLADAVPLKSWTLQNDHAATPDPDAGVGRPTPMPMAPDVRFHSPMLTKTVAGEDNVRAVHRLIRQIQGPRSYLARFASADRIVEYWTCVIEGHPQQGIDLFELDDQGRVTDQRVWLRPWPVTTLLRDRAMAERLPILADKWLLPAHSIPLA